MENIMIDLETMGTATNAPIIAIGAVAFGDGQLGAEFYSKVSLKSAVEHGAVIDPGTVIWWLKQDEAAQREFYKNDYDLDIVSALINFSNYVQCVCDINKAKIWGNGSYFDNVVLRTAFNNCGLEAPWRYYNNRCYRTIVANSSIKKERIGTAHNALDDAKSQALHLMQVQHQSIPLQLNLTL